VGNTKVMKEYGAEYVGWTQIEGGKDPSHERALRRERMGVPDGEEQQIQRGKKDEQTS
jgi:hypothetical protein